MQLLLNFKFGAKEMQKKKKKEFGGKAMRVKHIYRLKPYMMMNEKCEQFQLLYTAKQIRL